MWRNYNTTAKMFKKHSRHQIAERDYAQEVEPYLNITEAAFEKFKRSELIFVQSIDIMMRNC